jgi:hypothetical protein
MRESETIARSIAHQVLEDRRLYDCERIGRKVMREWVTYVGKDINLKLKLLKK